jgi:hypothetical protein
VKVVLLFALLFVVVGHVCASESSSDYSVLMGGAGASIVHTQSYWITSHSDVGFLTGGDDFNEGSAGTRIITGNGYSAVEKSDSYNASDSSVYKGNTLVSYDGGAVYDTTLYMGDNQPNVLEISCEASAIVAGQVATAGANPSRQSSEMHKSGIAAYGQFESKDRIDDANLTTSTTNEFGGGGLYTETRTELVEVGFDKNSSEMNFKKDTRDHFGKISSPDDNETSTFVSDYKYRDYSSPFGIANQSESNLTNSTP